MNRTSNDNAKVGTPWTQGRVLSGAVIAAGSQGLRRVARLVFFLSAARALSLEAFGLYMLFVTIIEFVSVLSGAGFSDFLAREASRSPAQSRTLLERLVALRWAYTFALCLLIGGCLWYGRVSLEAIGGFSVMSITLLPRSLAEGSQGVWRAQGNFSAFGAVELLHATSLLLTGFLWLPAFVHDLRGVALAELYCTLASGGLAALISWRTIPGAPVVHIAWKSLAAKAVPFNIYPFLVSAYDRIDVLLISIFLGSAAVGIYALSYRVLSTVQLIPYGIATVLLPMLSNRQGAKDQNEVLGRLLSVFLRSSLLCVLLTTLLADWSFRLVVSSPFWGGSTALKVLIWASIPMFINYGLNTQLLAGNQERRLMRITLVCISANILLNLVLIPWLGYVGAAAATILTEIVLLGQNLRLITGQLNLKPLQWRMAWDLLALALTTGAGVVASTRWHPLLVALVSACALILILVGPMALWTWFRNNMRGVSFFSYGGSAK